MVYENDIKDRTKKFAISTIKKTFLLREKGVEFSLRDQFLRSGTSIGANVREAKASSTKKELIRFYEIALRSANELDYWMDVISEGYNFENEFLEEEKQELNEISKVLDSIVVNLKK
ncbi:MAG: four helix bundle protein [Bacteroidetes bacterium]|nr:four helix bundle protein [Bacteroidota bacterium]